MPLYNLVSTCLEVDENTAKSWLVERYSSAIVKYQDILQPIILKDNLANKYIDESILNKYNYYHQYMFDRGLTKEVIRKFKIGYDKETNSLTFPVWDERGGLIGVTKRQVDTKKFIIPENIDKPIYLLNYIKSEGITKVYVCESQLNALTLWTWGYPAVALLGTGSSKQYDILNRSGIRDYVLCFDGDEAGYKGRNRFIKNIKNDVLISSKRIPQDKDVNDLSKEEFDNLEIF